MSTIFNVSDEEAKRIRLLHEQESKTQKIDSSLNDETVTNIISEGPFSGRQVHATLCCSAMMLGYWASTCPLPAVITASNGNRGAMYLNVGKMTINGNTPQAGQYFKAIESQNGTPTGNNPNGESSGLIYKVTAVSPWNPFYSTVNFPSAGGCPNCPGVSTWTCSPTHYMSSNYYTGQDGTCTELPTNCAPHATEQDCQNSSDPDCIQPETFDCNNGNCVTVQGTGGQYATYGQCQQNCQPPVPWKCNSNYQCVQHSSGTYATQQDCQQDCQEPPYSYDCEPTMGQCHQVPGGGGQFLTLTDCQQNCEYDGKWTCKEYDTRAPDLPVGLEDMAKELGESNHFGGMSATGWHCVKDPNGVHNTQAACQAQCPPRAEKIDCINCEEGIMTQVTAPDDCPQGFAPVTDLTHGPCVQCDSNVCTPCGWCYGTSPMTFNSMSECQNSQQCSQSGGYTCVGTQCQPDPNSNQTLQQCQANCPPQPNLWECDPGNGCSQTQNGTHQSQAACETACCQDVINNYGWATNHPNATSQQACNRIYNQFGQLGSFNPNNLPFDDGCEYDFLINIAGVCGVSANYQQTITNFIGGNNGCYGNQNAQNQGYGQGNPHQNSVCGKVEQFCEQPIGNVAPGTSNATQWYKCQWTQQQANTAGCNC